MGHADKVTPPLLEAAKERLARLNTHTRMAYIYVWLSANAIVDSKNTVFKVRRQCQAIKRYIGPNDKN